MKEYKSIYFVGAGGIGMAALERYFLAKGKKVAGYDRTPSELTSALQLEGVEISFDENPDLIPDYCRDKDTTLVVYTPAVPDDHKGLCYFRDNGFEVVKRARVLGLVTLDSKALCFAGTHGKTTTSSMAAHILQVSGVGSNAFLGGDHVKDNYGMEVTYSDRERFYPSGKAERIEILVSSEQMKKLDLLAKKGNRFTLIYAEDNGNDNV